jgi:hypothetical protein
MQVGRCSIGITVAVVVLAVAAPASAQIHQRIPEDIVPPIYSLLGHGFTPHTEEGSRCVLQVAGMCAG